jgi:hypothetical protein
MKLALVTLGDGDHCRRLAELVNPAKKAYCQRFGYDFIEFDQTLDSRRPPAWSKLLAILDVLPNYDWVVWHDSDTLIWNDGVGLQRFLPESQDEVFVIQGDVNGLNTGVFFAKNAPDAYRFLAKSYDQTQFDQHCLWEQIAMQHLFDRKQHAVPYKHIPPEAQKPLIQELYIFDAAPWTAPFLHLAGMRSDHRIDLAERLTRLAALPESDRLYFRNGLGDFLNNHHLLGTGVEVGAADRNFAHIILKSWEGQALHFIESGESISLTSDQSQVEISVNCIQLDSTKVHLPHWGDRIQTHRLDSRQAANQFADQGLDFVSLNGSHSGRELRDEIDIWFPKLRRGGLLLGQDCLGQQLSECGAGVQSTILQWERDNCLQVGCTSEKNFASWYVFKN